MRSSWTTTVSSASGGARISRHENESRPLDGRAPPARPLVADGDRPSASRRVRGRDGRSRRRWRPRPTAEPRRRAPEPSTGGRRGREPDDERRLRPADSRSTEERVARRRPPSRCAADGGRPGIGTARRRAGRRSSRGGPHAPAMRRDGAEARARGRAGRLSTRALGSAQSRRFAVGTVTTTPRSGWMTTRSVRARGERRSVYGMVPLAKRTAAGVSAMATTDGGTARDAPSWPARYAGARQVSRRSRRPGRSPVSTPARTAARPLTMTWSMPAGMAGRRPRTSPRRRRSPGRTRRGRRWRPRARRRGRGVRAARLAPRSAWRRRSRGRARRARGRTCPGPGPCSRRSAGAARRRRGCTWPGTTPLGIRADRDPGHGHDRLDVGLAHAVDDDRDVQPVVDRGHRSARSAGSAPSSSPSSASDRPDQSWWLPAYATRMPRPARVGGDVLPPRAPTLHLGEDPEPDLLVAQGGDALVDPEPEQGGRQDRGERRGRRGVRVLVRGHVQAVGPRALEDRRRPRRRGPRPRWHRT